MTILAMIMTGVMMYKYLKRRVQHKKTKVTLQTWIETTLDFRVPYIVIIKIVIRLKRLPLLILIHKSDLKNLRLSLLRKTKTKNRL